MNDGMLSQDEIDALLNVGADDDSEEKTNDASESSIDMSDYLSSIEIDTLGEIGNISFGSSATTLSTLLNQKVEITTPKVSIIPKSQVEEAFQFEHVSVQVNYVEGFTGKNVLIIKKEDAAIISDIMLGGNGLGPFGELNEIHLSAVQEAMNQMMGAAATSMSTVFAKRVDISPPSISQEKLQDAADDSTADVYVKVSFQLQVGSLIDSNIMQLMPVPFAKQLVDELLNNSQESHSESAVAIEESVNYQETTPVQANNATLTREATPEPQLIGNSMNQNQANIQQAEFSTFEQQSQMVSQPRNLDMLLDIPLKVTVELGRTRRTVKDILDLTSGSIIELDKLAGEPVDILVNEKLIAQGEVVVIDENFGVRVTDIISQSDRLMKLK
ncbi:flagellar motor switch phosphatase FliY [Ornithinibacillus sp. BX22]|uniref:Flagellar motor switch phosphatase FliY n=2 Tax=Ornithinibacillus TaxID=484508 RepID=A0A923L3Z2_9BACI|nr:MULTISPECIES: flagellar motor switch phosphatase FliY [Ornithinibacillus]MBC5635971.1 flagellar motor switch phosphatase FliY [Ornithinibacillus hominis]MBS3680040.1 flagellar motor switch phosphatase FliY [Ornithinibacillus massiliensis]